MSVGIWLLLCKWHSDQHPGAAKVRQTHPLVFFPSLRFFSNPVCFSDTTPEFSTLTLTFTTVTAYRRPFTWPTASWPCPSTNTETTFSQERVKSDPHPQYAAMYLDTTLLSVCVCVCVVFRWHVWSGSREWQVLLPECSSERRHRWPEWVSLHTYDDAFVFANAVNKAVVRRLPPALPASDQTGGGLLPAHVHRAAGRGSLRGYSGDGWQQSGRDHECFLPTVRRWLSGLRSTGLL